MACKLLTIDELGVALGGISSPTIYRHIKALPGFPQPVKVGASTRFRQSDVDLFVSSLGASERSNNRKGVIK